MPTQAGRRASRGGGGGPSLAAGVGGGVAVLLRALEQMQKDKDDKSLRDVQRANLEQIMGLREIEEARASRREPLTIEALTKALEEQDLRLEKTTKELAGSNVRLEKPGAGAAEGDAIKGIRDVITELGAAEAAQRLPAQQRTARVQSGTFDTTGAVTLPSNTGEVSAQGMLDTYEGLLTRVGILMDSKGEIREAREKFQIPDTEDDLEVVSRMLGLEYAKISGAQKEAFQDAQLAFLFREAPEDLSQGRIPADIVRRDPTFLELGERDAEGNVTLSEENRAFFSDQTQIEEAAFAFRGREGEGAASDLDVTRVMMEELGFDETQIEDAIGGEIEDPALNDAMARAANVMRVKGRLTPGEALEGEITSEFLAQAEIRRRENEIERLTIEGTPTEIARMSQTERFGLGRAGGLETTARGRARAGVEDNRTASLLEQISGASAVESGQITREDILEFLFLTAQEGATGPPPPGPLLP